MGLLERLDKKNQLNLAFWTKPTRIVFQRLTFIEKIFLTTVFETLNRKVNFRIVKQLMNTKNC